MLLQIDLCCEEMLSMMKLSYLQRVIKKFSFEGTYIIIGPSSTTSECIYDVPSKAHQNGSLEWKLHYEFKILTSQVQLTPI